MKEISFHPAAREELVEAVSSYLANVSPEIAIRCDTRMDEGIKAIQAHPLRFPVWESTPARRYVVPKFPYAIFYMERLDGIRIPAIAHTSRRPGYWKSRIAVA